MKSKVLILIAIYAILEIFLCPQAALTEINDRQYLHILKESGQYQKAYEGYESAIAKHPGSIPLDLDFIELLIDMERIDEAWNRLEKIEPEDINTLRDNDKRRFSLLSAQIFVKKEEFNKAITEIEPFADSKDDQLGDNPAAIDLLKRIPPKFQQPWSIQLLSKHYQEHGKWNKAIEVIKDYIKFHPDDTNTLLCLAYIYKRLNWKDEYQELIQSLLPSDGMERMHEQHLQKSPDSRSQTAYPQPLGA